MKAGDDVVIRDPEMRRVYEQGTRAAQGLLSILILGETGVGKDVLARALHRASPRAARPFLALNCAALSESLLESELFGHEKGAFTGALAARPGLFEAASSGTIFLDEIGDLPMTIQVKLLRVLEQREVLRVGARSAAGRRPLSLGHEQESRCGVGERFVPAGSLLPPQRARAHDSPSPPEARRGPLAREAVPCHGEPADG